MLISKTPLRVSFLGGGSDYSAYFGQSLGAVFGCTIDLFVYTNILELNEVSDENIRFSYRRTESVNFAHELQHPVLRAALSTYDFQNKVNISTMSDVPGNTGLGSSSAFSVGLIKLLHKFGGVDLEPDQVANMAIHIERVVLEEAGGLQDQIFAAHGGLKLITFNSNEYKVKGLNYQPEVLNNLSKHFALIPTKQIRDSSTFASRTVQEMKDGSAFMKSMKEDVDFLIKEIESREDFFSSKELLKLIEESLKRSWMTKKLLYSKTELTQISVLENLLKSLGASAFKICGAGATGFVFAIFPEPIQDNFDFLKDHNDWIFPKIYESGSDIFKI
jgi:D-glycero-alpha-D-manno-heptose-7-phosphate kinase